MKLPFELIIKIVEDACTDDFGKTAGNVGLVSKDSRTIAEPLELRCVAVSGIKQLEGFTARLERARARARGDGASKRSSRKVEVHHLFISEITEEHALALEIPFTRPIIRDRDTGMNVRGEDYWKDYWMMEDKLKNGHGDCSVDDGFTRELFKRREEWERLRNRLDWAYVKLGKKWTTLEWSYRLDARQFWSLTSALVKRSSPSLKSLSLLASDSWFGDRPLDRQPDRRYRRKVSRCLSGVSFPNLVYLAVDHNAEREDSAYRFRSPFLTPHCPQLRRLYIRSLNIALPAGPHTHAMHPLFRDYPSTLRDVCLCGGDVLTHIPRLLFGDDRGSLAAGNRLPGNLRSLVLRLDYLPLSALRKVSWFQKFEHALKRDPRMLKGDIKRVKALHIDGLEVLLPYWHSSEFRVHYPYWTWFPEEGQRHYGPMLAEMLKECRKSA